MSTVAYGLISQGRHYLHLCAYRIDVVCAQLARHLQPGLIDVGDDNLGGAHRLGGQQIHQPCGSISYSLRPGFDYPVLFINEHFFIYKK